MKRMSRMEGEKPTLMVIPMIDIIFFLLVFFMISTIYTIPQQSLSIMLPKTKTQQSAELRPVLIDFEKSGQLMIDDGYVTKEFFRSFKLNFIPATILWMILAVMTFIMQLNVGILMKKSSGMVGLFFICFYALVSVYLIIVACYAFPALSRFDMNVGWILKISMYMVVRYIFTSIMLVIILVCIGAIVWKLPLLVFFVPGPIAFLMSEFLERVLKKHEPNVEEGGTAE